MWTISVATYAVRYFLSDKRAATCADALLRFLTTVVRPSGYRLGALHTDRGTEFFGEFERLCSDHSIRLRRSVPYRHETNGIAERANRTHSEMTRAMLIHADRPFSFWDFAMGAAVYICNRLPTVANPGYATPYYLVMGELPDLSQLRVWGCPCIERATAKWPRQPIMSSIFVGFAADGPGHLLYDPMTGAVRVSIDTVFDEKFVLSASKPSTVPRYGDITSDFYYDPLHKVSLLDQTVSGPDHPTIRVPVPLESVEVDRPAWQHKLYGLVMHLLETEIAESQEAAGEAAEARRRSRNRTLRSQGKATSHACNRPESMDIEASRAEEEQVFTRDEPPTNDPGEQGRREDLEEAPATSLSAEEVMCVMYPCVQSVMLCSHDNVSNTMCREGTTHSLYGMRSQKLLVHLYMTRPQIGRASCRERV